MQIALSQTSATTTPMGMLAVVGDRCWLLSAWFPRVLQRAALPRQRSMPGARYADARSPSPRRSSGTAVWDVRSMRAAWMAAPMAACPPCRAPSRFAAAPCAAAPTAGGICNWDEPNQSCASAETVWARRVATPASVIRRALSSLRVSGRANILGVYVDGRSQRRSRSGQGLHTSPCMENA